MKNEVSIVNIKNVKFNSSEVLERAIYGVITTIACAIPFIIPGLNARQSVELFFGIIVLTFFGLLIYGGMSGSRVRNRTYRK